MRRVSTKEAARRFYQLLDAAEEAPVMIERHGRPRAAIVSARDFEIVARILAREKDWLAAEFLGAAIKRVEDGHFNKAIALKNAALLIGGVLK
ncbi:MAG: type II toxin-antitoxin system Phd/YefM family antitoxin [Pseudomonadota bacterium]